MKKELAYMATALAMASQGLEPPVYSRAKPQPRKCDQKKCKSCKSFDKKRLEKRDPCMAGVRCYSPWQVACDKYKKRK